MTEKEIREAVKVTKKIGLDGEDEQSNLGEDFKRSLRTLLTLAEEYLKVEGWPEEEKEEYANLERADNPSYVAGEEWNKALRLCKLAAMKEKNKVSREQIEGCLNSVFSDYALNGQGNKSLIKSLTEEFLELINGKEA